MKSGLEPLVKMWAVWIHALSHDRSPFSKYVLNTQFHSHENDSHSMHEQETALKVMSVFSSHSGGRIGIPTCSSNRFKSESLCTFHALLLTLSRHSLLTRVALTCKYCKDVFFPRDWFLMFTFGESVECAPTRVLAGTMESWSLWLCFCQCDKLLVVLFKEHI